MTFEDKASIVISQLREDRDRLEDILEKIRAEIEHLTYYWCEVNPRTVIDDVLQIIDKYKEESEE